MGGQRIEPPVDLRSDTVTKPDPRMRRAMAEAEVGDDVLGEDPTVRRLEERAAELLGQEAGLYVPSGTMGNQVALHVHGFPGGEVICDSRSHILHYEMGAMAALSGLMARTVDTVHGQLDPGSVDALIAPGGSLRARTALIVAENSHNVAGGTVYEPEELDALVALARRRGLPIHLDGARVFNAAAAVGEPAGRLTGGFDSVMVALSKGLGAPVGSVLCGGESFVDEARRVRKMFGGGMRQAGVIAGAGLVALEENRERLAEDHHHARMLAEALAELPGIEIDLPRVRTNILVFGVGRELFPDLPEARDPVDELVERLGRRGVLGARISETRARLVTHRDVSREQVEQAVEAIRGLAS
jgi:threonine aldolase